MNKETTKENMPWIEKYRPDTFRDIVLESTNKEFLKNIIKQNIFPNLLFYGPPGTGKTTTIINLINKYQEKYNQKNKGLKIHLNASDDRGIDIIRNQINTFVNTKSLFGKGVKFVILDEVDYMTKNAQKALRYLIQQYSENIRFCLICNYISRIDTSLQNEFVRLRFSQLPMKNIHSFLKNIIVKEKLNIKRTKVNSIINLFYPDVRSMINYLQSNCVEYDSVQTSSTKKIIKKYSDNISSKTYDEIMKNMKNTKTKNSVDQIIKEIKMICMIYSIKIKNFLEYFIEYLFDCEEFIYNKEILNIIEFTFHNLNNEPTYLLYFFIEKIYNALHCEDKNTISHTTTN